MSLIVYLKKNKAFCKASGSLAQSSLASTFFIYLFFLLTSLLFCSYPQDTIVFKLFYCVCIFWVYYCLYSVLAALVIFSYSLVAFTGSQSGKECLLNAQNVIPTLSVVTAVLFRLDFVSNVFGLF